MWIDCWRPLLGFASVAVSQQMGRDWTGRKHGQTGWVRRWIGDLSKAAASSLRRGNVWRLYCFAVGPCWLGSLGERVAPVPSCEGVVSGRRAGTAQQAAAFFFTQPPWLASWLQGYSPTARNPSAAREAASACLVLSCPVLSSESTHCPLLAGPNWILSLSCPASPVSYCHSATHSLPQTPPQRSSSSLSSRVSWRPSSLL